MAADITKLVLDSSRPAFKNNTVFEGSFNISGTASGGVNTRTTTVNIGQAPDLADVIFNGRADPSAAIFRPSTGWFKQGNVLVQADDDGFTFNTPWQIAYRFSGTNLTVTATYTQQFTSTVTLTTAEVKYRVVDYSVF